MSSGVYTSSLPAPRVRPGAEPGHPRGEQVQRGQLAQLGGGAAAAAAGAVSLLILAVSDPVVYRRLRVLLGIVIALGLVGCVLGLVWRVAFPMPRDFPVPVIMA